MSKLVPKAIGHSRFMQVVAWLFITIFLGAIGSGLWELILGPMAQKLSNASRYVSASLFHGFLDTLAGKPRFLWSVPLRCFRRA